MNNLTDKIKDNLISEAAADEFRFKLKKILNLNKSQMKNIMAFVDRKDYTNAILKYKNFLNATDEAAQNFIIGLAAAQALSDKSKFGKTV